MAATAALIAVSPFLACERECDVSQRALTAWRAAATGAPTTSPEKVDVRTRALADVVKDASANDLVKASKGMVVQLGSDGEDGQFARAFVEEVLGKLICGGDVTNARQVMTVYIPRDIDTLPFEYFVCTACPPSRRGDMLLAIIELAAEHNLPTHKQAMMSARRMFGGLVQFEGDEAAFLRNAQGYAKLNELECDYSYPTAVLRGDPTEERGPWVLKVISK